MGPKCCDECPGDDTCEHAAICMCGDYMEGHANGMDSGHTPLSMHRYYAEDLGKLMGDRPRAPDRPDDLPF